LQYVDAVCAARLIKRVNSPATHQSGLGHHQRRLAFWILLLPALLLCAGRTQAADQNWPTYLGDAARSHFSPLDQIDRRNVRRLEVAWVYHSGDAREDRSQNQCNPLIIDGVLYGTSPQLKLLALDAATGRELWRFDPAAEDRHPGSIAVNRGVVYWADGNDRRILYVAGNFLHAVDAKTGKLIPTFGTGGG